MVKGVLLLVDTVVISGYQAYGVEVEGVMVSSEVVFS